MPSTSSFYSIINNVYDSASNSLRMSLNFTHTHSSGSGGQLDWDVVWSDAVHSHGTDTEGGQLDHGLSMTTASLADEDHPAYVAKSVVTANGDLFIATGSATVSKLAAGSANYVLTSNGVGSQSSWQALSAAITNGSYTGNEGTNRAITHSLGKTPQWVKIQDNVGDITHNIIGGKLYGLAVGTGYIFTVTVPDGTSFYVGTGVSMTNAANGSSRSYQWVAFG